ncbi:MAG: hypothetical protein LBS81_03655 [Endomicrobium sp.]|jgi:hypothetical protein|nr:hypothetical protein [Endomicrobium sp.]
MENFSDYSINLKRNAELFLAETVTIDGNISGEVGAVIKAESSSASIKISKVELSTINQTEVMEELYTLVTAQLLRWIL